MRKYVLLTTLALAMVAVFAAAAGPALACPPLSPGYWMNHPAAWPYDTITVGGVQYSEVDAIALMRMPTRGDMTLAMFQAVVAARLNMDNFSAVDTQTWEAWFACDTWMSAHAPGSGVRASSGAWQGIESDYSMMVAWWALD